MDDTSIQYRIRMAQINGIKLDEAFSDEHLDVLRNTPGKTLGDKFDHLGKDKAEDLIQKIKGERTKNINAGQSSYKNLMHHDLAIGAHGAWKRKLQKADKLDEAKETPEHLTPEYKDKMEKLQAKVNATREARESAAASVKNAKAAARAANSALETAHDNHRNAENAHHDATLELQNHQDLDPKYRDLRQKAAAIKKLKDDEASENIKKKYAGFTPPPPAGYTGPENSDPWFLSKRDKE
jgi:chromosome segregation ATPase